MSPPPPTAEGRRPERGYIGPWY